MTEAVAAPETKPNAAGLKFGDLPPWAKAGGGTVGALIVAAWMWASQLTGQMATVEAATQDLPSLATRISDLEKARAAEDARQLDLGRRLDRMETTADRILVRLESISDRLGK